MRDDAEKKRVYIQDDLSRAIYSAHEVIAPTIETVPYIDRRCPCCGHPILFPRVATARDLQVLRELIGLAKKWLREEGVEKRMILDILERCRVALVKKGMN